MNAYNLWHNGLAVLRARWYLRHANYLGPKVRLWGRPSVHNYGKMMIGERSRLVSTTATLELAAAAGAELLIGKSVYINYGCSIAATRHIAIGDHCTIGPHVLMMDTDYHRLEPDRRQECPEPAPVRLEENVWLGARVIVLRGVTIGADSVIGAGSVVTEDIPPGVVAAGMPAKVIRSLTAQHNTASVRHSRETLSSLVSPTAILEVAEF